MTTACRIDVWRGELSVGDAPPDGLAQRDRDGRHRGAQERRADAAPTGRRGAPAPPLRGRRWRRLGRPHRRRGQRADARVRRRRRPAPAGDAYGDLPGAVPEPVGGSAAPPCSASARARWRSRPLLGRHAQRSARPARSCRRMSRAETRRRAAMGLLALVGVVFVLGLVLVLVPRGSDVQRGPRRSPAATRPSGRARLGQPRRQPPRRPSRTTAMDYYREAWTEIEQARATGLSARRSTRSRRASAPASMRSTARRPDHRSLASCPRVRTRPTREATAGGAVYIDRGRHGLSRQPQDGKVASIVTAGDKRQRRQVEHRRARAAGRGRLRDHRRRQGPALALAALEHSGAGTLAS